MVNEEVWTNDTCLICQLKYPDKSDRHKHEQEDGHKKKFLIFDFIKELSCLNPSTIDSVLFDRYSRANVAAGGLECINELHVSWSNAPLWVCTACYVAGDSLDSVDAHLYSSSHRKNYIAVHHSDRFEELIADQQNCNPDECLDLEYELIQKLLYDAKCLSPPDVFILEDRGEECMRRQLLLSEKSSPDENYLIEPISDSHHIVQCLICNECFFAYENDCLFRQAWNIHLSTDVHQKCQMMISILREGHHIEKLGIPEYCCSKNDFVYTQSNNTFYGPSCGFDFLVDFKDEKECFCKLCFCVVSKHEATEHFSSEYHAQRYVRYYNPSKLLNSEFMEVNERHGILLEVIRKGKNKSKYMQCSGMMPRLLWRFSKAEKRNFNSISVEEIKIGINRAVWCKDCNLHIKIVNDSDWQNHLLEDDHFEMCTKKALYNYDTSNLIIKSTALPSFRKAGKGWEEKFLQSLESIMVQDHCHYGLEFVVRDELSRQTTCLSCCFTCTYEDDENMSFHVRSFEHICRIMHLINKKFLSLLWKNSNVDQQKVMLLDYLKRCRLTADNKPMVYDPVWALNANCYGTVSKLMLDLAKLPPELRETHLASIRNFDNDYVPFNFAMRFANIELKHVESVLVLFCQDCNQSFSCATENINQRFAEHLFSKSHWNRYQAFKENQLDENKRVNQKSSFVVTPFFQINKSKKVTWKWNETRKTFEFVYAQLGLFDICERRNFKQRRDLFCKLCAESFKAGKYDLEHHIRSFAHVFYYVHNHRPSTIPDLETILLEEADMPSKHRNIRRLFAKALRDLENEMGEIMIYDMSLSFCDSADVKDALDKERLEEIAPMELMKKPSAGNLDRSVEIYWNSQQINGVKSSEDIQQFLVYALNSSAISESRNELTLEAAKEKILTAAVMEASVKTNVSSAVTTFALEQSPFEPSAVMMNESSVPDGRQLLQSDKKNTVDADGGARETLRLGERRRILPPPKRSPPPKRLSLTKRPSPPPRTSSRQSDRKSSSPPIHKRGEEYRTSHNKTVRHNCRRSPSPTHKSLAYRSLSPRAKAFYLGKKVTTPEKHINKSKSRSRSPTHGTKSSTMTTRFRTATSPQHVSSSRETSRLRMETYRRRKSASSNSNSSKMSGDDDDSGSLFTSAKILQKRNEEKNATNKIQINMPSTLKSTPELGYRIRNAPADPSKISHKNIDPVDPYAEEIQELDTISTSFPRAPSSRWDKSTKVSKSASERLSALDKSSNNKRNADASKLDPIDAAHLRAVNDFLAKNASKSSASLSASASTAPVTSLTRSGMSSQLFGGLSDISAQNQVAQSLLNTGFQQQAAAFGFNSTTLTGVPPPIINPLGFVMPPTNPFGAGSLAQTVLNPSISTLVPNSSAATSMEFNFPSSAVHPFVPPPVVDQTELMLRAKMELYQHDLDSLKNVTELIEYLWKQGYDQIPPGDPPLLFNDVVQKRPGILGANTLYQILCYGHPELETYYCGMCNHWTTVSEMFVHLTASMHRLNYMFRNYKMYQRKVMEERDEVVRDMMLERFAQQIWQLEGSGKCSHRMRCILNESSIRRLWPEYENFVDNSWKLMGIDLDLPIRSTASTLPTTSSSAPPQEKQEDSLTRREGAIAKSGFHEFATQLDALRKTSGDSAKIAEVTTTRDLLREKERSSRSARSPTSKKRRERSRSRSSSRSRSHRNRSASPSHRSSKRSSNRSPKDEERSKKRRRGSRSRSPRDRTDTTSFNDHRRRSKSPKPKSAADEDWSAKAAAFLNRIGNRQDATKLYLSSFEKEYENEEANHNLAKSGPPADERSKPLSLEDRLRKTSSDQLKGLNQAEKDVIASEMAKELARRPSSRTSNEEEQRKQSSRSNRRYPQSTAADNQGTETRKVIGVIVELQSIYEAEGRLPGETVFKVCEDMGIPAINALRNALIIQAASTFGVDLNEGYETYLSNKLMSKLQSGMEKQQSSSTNFMGLSSEVIEILKKVNAGEKPSVAANLSMRKDDDLAASQYRRRQPYEPELNEEINYVYPPRDEREKSSGQCRGAPPTSGRDPNKVESTINRLTYAFAAKKQGQQKTSIYSHHQRQQDDDASAHATLDFQRFSDEEDEPMALNRNEWTADHQVLLREHMRTVTAKLAEERRGNGSSGQTQPNNGTELSGYGSGSRNGGGGLQFTGLTSSTATASSTLSAPPIAYLPAQQRAPFGEQQQRQQREQLLATQQREREYDGPYMRGSGSGSTAGQSTSASGSGGAGTAHHNMNSFVNMASQIGDDWSSLGNCLNNFLKNNTSTNGGRK